MKARCVGCTLSVSSPPCLSRKAVKFWMMYDRFNPSNELRPTSGIPKELDIFTDNAFIDGEDIQSVLRHSSKSVLTFNREGLVRLFSPSNIPKWFLPFNDTAPTPVLRNSMKARNVSKNLFFSDVFLK